VLRRLQARHPVVLPSQVRDLLLGDETVKNVAPERLVTRLGRDFSHFWRQVTFRDRRLLVFHEWNDWDPDDVRAAQAALEDERRVAGAMSLGF
jgi:hypothetical protein